MHNASIFAVTLAGNVTRIVCDFGLFQRSFIFSSLYLTVAGIRRFLMDVEVMLGEKVLGCVPFGVTKNWWFVAWAVITPTGLLVRFIIGMNFIFVVIIDV